MSATCLHKVFPSISLEMIDLLILTATATATAATAAVLLTQNALQFYAGHLLTHYQFISFLLLCFPYTYFL